MNMRVLDAVRKTPYAEAVKNMQFNDLRGFVCFIPSVIVGEVIEVSVNGTDYVLVHGAPLCTFSESSRSRTAREHAVWTRLGRNTPMIEGKMVIFGHTPTHHYLPDFPMRIWHGRDKIGIDCGCAWGVDGRLGCLRLDDMAEFYSEEEV